MESKRIFNFTEFVKIDSSYITGRLQLMTRLQTKRPMTNLFKEVIPEDSPQDADAVEEEKVTEDDAPVEEYAEEEYYEEEWPEPEYSYIDVLTLPTLRLMRDEIGAWNGLRPADSENASRFEREGYSMQYNSLEEVQNNLSDIDTHNCDFLNHIIGEMESGNNAISGI